MRALFSVLIGYLAVPVLNAVSPLIALPAITSTHGAGAWAAIAIGQSLGSTAGVLIELGWGLSGSQRVARMSARNRGRVFATSLVTKGIVAVPVLALALPIAFVLTPAFGGIAALIALASGLAALGAGWIFIGMMRPRLFLVTEVLPRTVLVAASAVAISAGLPLVLYPLALLVAALSPPVAAALVLGTRPADFRALGPRRLRAVIRMQGHALSTNIFSSIYLSLGTTVATLGSVNATLLYASADRLKRMVQQVVLTQQYVLKGWVGREVDPSRRIARAVRATLLTALVGVLCGIAFAFAAPLAADFVFSGTVDIPPLAAAIAGANLAVVCTSMATGAVLLVTLGRVGAIARSAAVGAVIGLPAIFVGALLWQGTGALAGQLLAEVAVIAVQLAAIRARRRELMRSGRWVARLRVREASTAAPE
ncbi:MAG: oligosaccharide flippase family protein [Actinobacteria bacterium]|nr:oligosaccharide flippase family protein [Actinomycetota bacterium]